MGREGGREREVLLWAALAAALSPVLADLARHLAATPWARYSVVFLFLTIRAALRDTTWASARGDGFVLLFLALGFEVLTVGGGIPRAGRVAIPLAVLGLARTRGYPRLAIAALIAWCVPVPNALVTMASPRLERGLAFASVGLWRDFGLALRLEGAQVVARQGRLALEAADGGIPLLALLSGMGWYAATLRGGRLGNSIGTAGVWAFSALPLQIGAVFLAVGVAGLGAPEAARLGLSYVPWIGAAMLSWRIAERAGIPSTGKVNV
jgi:hypothetical protein